MIIKAKHETRDGLMHLKLNLNCALVMWLCSMYKDSDNGFSYVVDE